MSTRRIFTCDFFTDNIKDEPPGPNLSGPVRGVRSRLGGRASVNVTSPGFLQPLALGLPELDSQVTRWIYVIDHRSTADRPVRRRRSPLRGGGIRFTKVRVKTDWSVQTFSIIALFFNNRQCFFFPIGITRRAMGERIDPKEESALELKEKRIEPRVERLSEYSLRNQWKYVTFF